MIGDGKSSRVLLRGQDRIILSYQFLYLYLPIEESQEDWPLGVFTFPFAFTFAFAAAFALSFALWSLREVWTFRTRSCSKEEYGLQHDGGTYKVREVAVVIEERGRGRVWRGAAA